MKILLINESQFMRETLKQIIKDYTTDIHEAEDLESAIENFRQTGPDIVFLDIMMEKTDTDISILQALNKERENTKLIIVSSLDISNKLVQKALQMNVDGYVQKPFNKEKVQKYLN